MLTRLFAAISTVLTVFAGTALLFIGFARGVDAGFGGIGLWPAAAGLSMIAGAIAAHTSARIGTTLVAFGALTIVAMMPWLIAITLPLALIAIFGTLARGKGAPARPA